MRIIKIPWDSGSMNKNPGAKKAPDAIIKELDNMHLTEESRKTPYKTEEVNVNKENFEETNEAIYAKVKEAKQDAIIIGGDHSITFAAVQAYAKMNAGASVVMIDAHPDCQSDFLPPTHEDFIRGIVNQGIIPPERILLIGVRNWHEDEQAFLQEHGIKTITMQEAGRLGIHETIKRVLTTIKDWESVYLSIDIDAADPAYAPATGYPEPGGFTNQELITLVQSLKQSANVKMADLVEINPDLDPDGRTIRLGARIIKELL